MIKNRIINHCDICHSDQIQLKFSYNAPPMGETIFPFSHEGYHREYWECLSCHHLNSTAVLDLKSLYSGDYGNSTYRDIEGIHKNFLRITQLPLDKSDNKHRTQFVSEFTQFYLKKRPEKIRLLDIGSGLGVFPYEMKNLGFQSSALDPDSKSVEHIRTRLNINCYSENIYDLSKSHQFDLITLNKVLEHVEDPSDFLKTCFKNLTPNGLIYIELPDAEGAATAGQDREEFFVEHLHVFSSLSLTTLGVSLGLNLLLLQKIQEPSSKFTYRSLWQLK